MELIGKQPEDENQNQSLLDGFQAYAKSRGKNIVVEHRPVVSVNYYSILDIQLSRGEGPDLFYVRPFSVDGSIAKYLIMLNGELDLDANYDPTKIVPWTNRSGSYYAVPFVGVVQGVYYNKDLFTRYGLSVPRTWDQLMAIVKKIAEQEKDPGMIPIANALNQTEDSEMFLEWLMSKAAVDLTAENLAGFYPLNRAETSKAGGLNDAKFLKLVNTYDEDNRWMYTEISSKTPSALEIIRKDLYQMLADDLTPQEAAQHLQSGLGEWYEPAQNCKNK